LSKNVAKSLCTGIYVRVSTDEQVQEGFSIRAQSEKLKSYALLKDWEIYNTYTDEGISGKNIVDRPAINRLLEDIKAGKVNNVLVFKVDRLTRSTKNLIELVELFEEYNCAFNSLTESIDTDTPSGRMFLKIIGIFAEFERENLVSRLKLGFERKVKEGYTLATGSVSYGYIKKKGQKLQEIQPDEARVVREIFSMYVDENKTLNGIATALNQRKIKSKTGSVWNSTVIKELLTNPTYIGKVRYSVKNDSKYFEAQGNHERIVSDEMYALAQDKIKRTSRISRTKQPRQEHYFCGVLVCSLCGAKFSTHHRLSGTNEQGEKQYKRAYRCNKKVYHRKNNICKCPYIAHYKVEEAFVRYIENITDFANVSDIELNSPADNNSKNEQQEHIAACESRLSNLAIRKRRLMTQYVAEDISFDEYRELIDIINEKYEALEIELQITKNEAQATDEASTVSHNDIILNLKENWDYLTNMDKMIFLQRFVKEIRISVEKVNRSSNVAKVDEVKFN